MQGAFFPPMESLTWFRFLVALIPQVWTILTSPFSRWKKKLSRERDGWRIYDAITSWIIYVISSVSAKILNKSLVQQLKITMAMTISMTNKQNVKSRKTGGLPPTPGQYQTYFIDVELLMKKYPHSFRKKINPRTTFYLERNIWLRAWTYNCNKDRVSVGIQRLQ